jgi:hypothetical protein
VDHQNLDLHFLITGNAKFAPDWCFGLIKQCFKRVNTEIAGVVKDSTVTGVTLTGVNIPVSALQVKKKKKINCMRLLLSKPGR